MRLAQASAVGRKFIPADEAVFLKGWTLCVVETKGDDQEAQDVKVLIHLQADADAWQQLWTGLQRVCFETSSKVELNWTVSTARRERLCMEPIPPTGFICLWLSSVKKAHEAFEPSSELRELLERQTKNAVAYLIDQLCIR